MPRRSSSGKSIPSKVSMASSQLESKSASFRSPPGAPASSSGGLINYEVGTEKSVSMLSYTVINRAFLKTYTVTSSSGAHFPPSKLEIAKIKSHGNSSCMLQQRASISCNGGKETMGWTQNCAPDCIAPDQ